MPFDFAVGAGERCTLYSRSEYRSSFPAGAAGEASGRNMVSSISPSAAARDSAQLAALYEFMKDCTRYSGSSAAEDLVRALKRAVDGSDLFAVVEQRQSSGAGSGGNEPRPRSITFTPSQLFGGAARIAGSIGAYAPVLPRLAAEDHMAAWLARPGDVLPDGRIATPLADAQPFEYTPDAVSGEVEQDAGMPFNGAPGSWASSMPGTMSQLRQYGPGGTPMTDIDFEAHHGNTNPHAHNWVGYDRDEGAPVSILPW